MDNALPHVELALLANDLTSEENTYTDGYA